ncbi:helix-turn-helix domain-containing protein [Enterococcus faecium]|uniref:helix-turn-helix domain-containing protein n=1 Tax=Enterococcus faecium TaxID=1352 RepID=UPI0003A6A8A8|nr:helix-turn-helix transcriptional regulator [Enterococcus faecium]KFO17748.1 transcriptional regulator [Enterococcus faecium UC7267]KGK77619.1 transcriptional regulator [Enterococcus faecium]MCR9049886.1 helix-turn-helix domain-containing protein [Enterococcus faecium]
MFGLLQPDKVKVGQRIKEIKESMNLSFTELGNRMGIKKPTISSYVQGYALAPENVINQLSSISGKPVGWFYFGNIEEYIADYLKLKGQGKLIKAYPEVVNEIREEFFTGDFKNPGWENEVGYPMEEFIDDCFADILPKIMTRYVSDIVNEQVVNSNKLKELTDKEKEEAAIIIASDTNDFIEVSGEIKFGEKDKIIKMVNNSIDSLAGKGSIEFSEEYLIGKLINVLDDDKATERMISDLSQDLMAKPFCTLFGGEELVRIFQSIRPKLMKLYLEKTPDEISEWFDR